MHVYCVGGHFFCIVKVCNYKVFHKIVFKIHIVMGIVVLFVLDMGTRKNVVN